MPDGGRRGLVAGGIIALVLVAFSVFVLPFAFTTPPPIITRFVATRAFSPGNDQGRAVATVAIRLSEPSNVAITVKDPETGEVVARLADGTEVVRRRTLAVRWDGTGPDGRTVPDGSYAVDLSARAGEKKFSKSRRIVVDTTAPSPAVTVQSVPAGCLATAASPGEPATITFSAPTAGVTSEPRSIGARGTTSWTWDGRDSRGRRVAPGIQPVRTVARDERGNRASRVLTCWVAHLDARAVPGQPASGDAVGVAIAGRGNPEVTLSLRQRLGTPGDPVGTRILGDPIGDPVTGPASQARITIPEGVRPAEVWLLAATGPGRQALIGFREGG